MTTPQERLDIAAAQQRKADALINKALLAHQAAKMANEPETPESIVTVQQPEPPKNVIVQAAETTAQESETGLRTAGQRRINIIWEYTQALIALAVTGVALYAALMLVQYILRAADTGTEISVAVAALVTAAFVLLSNLVNLVIGFYFGRTNHQRVGGIGDNIVGR